MRNSRSKGAAGKPLVSWYKGRKWETESNLNEKKTSDSFPKKRKSLGKVSSFVG